MRITIDTELERVIVPNSFFSQIEKRNKVLEEAGVEKKIDHVEFVQEAFAKAIKNTLFRPSDAKGK